MICHFQQIRAGGITNVGKETMYHVKDRLLYGMCGIGALAFAGIRAAEFAIAPVVFPGIYMRAG